MIGAVAGQGDVRASDAEREEVVGRLREGAADGRLDPEELERRVEQAYRAESRGELERLAADLPLPPAPAPSRWTSEAMRRRAAGFVTVNAVCIAVWLASGASGGFWPIWVILVSGIGFFGSAVRTAFGVPEDGRRGGRRARRRL
jgi:DUF1707 SHOCT-like domain